MIWEATVVRVEGRKVWVKIARQARGVYGPCPMAEGVFDGDMTGSNGGISAHQHPRAETPLAVGDRVFAAFLEGRSERIGILARIE
jgi:hypothetical protein